MKKFLMLLMISLLTPVRLSAQADTEAVSRAIDRQMASYPASTLKDLYKSFFQDAFGPGHLLDDGDEAQACASEYLRRECEEAAREPSLSPEYELTGATGQFVRVNLSVVNSGKVPFSLFLDAFLRSAKSFRLPEISDWQSRWAEIEKTIREKGLSLPDMEADAAAIRTLLDSGQYASHHSKAYEEACHPHYRLIERGIFTEEILPLLQ